MVLDCWQLRMIRKKEKKDQNIDSYQAQMKDTPTPIHIQLAPLPPVLFSVASVEPPRNLNPVPRVITAY